MTKAKNNTKRTGLEIAVIGMSGRFPGARNIDEFWNNLVNGVETIAFFTKEELKTNGVFPINPDAPNYVGSIGIIEDAEYFDESFFNYTPLEAEIMDPQSRIFHEISWEALENAGYDPDTFDGLIGVYAGATPNFNWEGVIKYSDAAKNMGKIGVRTLSDKDFLSTLVSYKLNLKGPSYTLYTACSTSLVTIDQACRALLTAECDMALAGGVTNSYPSRKGYIYIEGMMYSKDGHCRTFDANANGTVFGNGAGVVVLKRLDEAIADRDCILAVIKSTGINNDGLSKVGFTAPSVEGQAAAIRMTMQMARVPPESITYIEAHGTGTILGDPIEIEGLKLAFNSKKRQYCAIGSVKTNVGHLDCAAGIAGLIKTVLSIHNRQIPPTLHFEKANPKINFENSPFYINTELKEWKNDMYPLRAGVNSFGIGGTNAHAILEEAPPKETSSPNRQWKLLPFSARTPDALDNRTRDFANFLKQHPDTNLADAAFTLQVGRKEFNHRRILVNSTSDDTVDILAAKEIDNRQVLTGTTVGENRPVVFMFPGQGSQYVDMGMGLYRTEVVFTREMDRCFDILKPLMKFDIKEVLYPSLSSLPQHAAGDQPDINQTKIAQPLLFAIEYALSVLLMTWGIKPQMMTGHSIGEYVAACLSGVLSLQDALALVTLRGELMQQMPAGSMVSVPLPEEQLENLLKNHKNLSIATVNDPSQCVISGPNKTVTDFVKGLKENGIEAKQLHTSHAFHSMMMDPVLEQFEKKVSGVTLNKPNIPYISNVTGRQISPTDAMNPSYYATHIRETVRFSDGLAHLLKNEPAIFIEVGPGQVISTLVKQHPGKKIGHLITNLIRHPKDNVPDDRFLLNKIGQLWIWGQKIDWMAMYTSSSQKRYRIPLPIYPFERQRYVIQGNPLEKAIATPVNKATQRKEDIAAWFYLPSWKRSQLPVKRNIDVTVRDSWLLFMDEIGLGQEMLNRLEEEGFDVIIIQVAPGFKKVSSQLYTINPRLPEDYDSLLEELASQNRIPRFIVHMGLFTDIDPDNGFRGSDSLDLAKVERLQDLGFYNLVNLAKSIARRNFDQEFHLTVVSNNMQDVTGEAVLCPGKATLLGPVRIIPKEYPNITCQSIDFYIPVSWNPDKKQMETNTNLDLWQKEKTKIARQLWAEVTLKEADSPGIIAYRNDIRWVQTLEPFRWEEAGEEIPSLKEEGVYLITGGLGGIGFVLAEHLAKTVKAKLVLTGRTVLPDRKNWPQILNTSHEDGNMIQKISNVMALEEMGAQVMVLSADVTDLEQMQQVILQIKNKFGHINGVIHTAGLPDAGLMQAKSREFLEKVLAPKIRGTIILDRVLKHIELDFFFLCSSVVSILAPVGQVAYCAANNFLDAFAHYRTFRDQRLTVSIAWDGWQDVGMLVNVAKEKFKRDGGKIPESRKLNHFLFEKYIFNPPNQEIFISRFKVEKYWFLGEHRIMGTVIMLGTAYLEMAAAAFESHVGDGLLEIQNVQFLQPMVLREDEEKEVQSVLLNHGQYVEFMVMSRTSRSAGNESSDWTPHARGELKSVPKEAPKKHDLNKIQALCSDREVDIEPNESKTVNRRFMQVSQRWNSVKKISLGKKQGLAAFELLDKYADDMKVFKIHPALLDHATNFLVKYESEETSRYLPFSYKKMKINAPFPPKIFSHSVYLEEADPGKIELKFKVTIMDEQGTELAFIEEYSVLTVSEIGKPKVEEVKNKYPLSSVFTTGSSGSNKKEMQKSGDIGETSLTLGILSAEGIDIFNRILGGNLPHVVISTSDLPARIENSNLFLKRMSATKEKKVDTGKGSRPIRSRPDQQVTYVSPGNEVEQKLVNILQEFLGIDIIGVKDDFFEMGGDSLKAINITSRIKKEFGVEIQFAEMFVMSTVQRLAGHIANQLESGKVPVYKNIEPVEKKEYYPLSPSQTQLFVLQQVNKESIGYNEFIKTELDFDFTVKKLESILFKLIQRYESLRTSFELINEMPVQRIHKELKPKIEFYDENPENQEEVMANFLNKPFDLAKPPLFKTLVIKTAEGKSKLITTAHHIISDNVALEIIIRDTLDIALKKELNPLKIDYKDYAFWMNTKEQKISIEEQGAYWLKEFSGEIPTLNLPYDYPRPLVQSFEGGAVPFEIERSKIEKLRQMAIEKSTTPYIVLLSIYYILLAKLSGQEDIIIGNAISLRNQPELSDVVGLFLNTLALRNFPQKEKTFEDFLEEVKKKTQEAFKNSHYLFEDLVRKLALRRGPGRNPLFDVALTLDVMDKNLPTFELKGEKYRSNEAENNISKFDLTLFIAQVGEDMKFTFEYYKSLFTREKVTRFAGYFKEIMSSVLENKHIKLKDIKISHEILTAREKITKTDFVFQE